MYLKDAVLKVFNELPNGTQFRGWELKQSVVRLRPESKNAYVDSVLRQLRKCCHGRYIVIGPTKNSLYQKIS